MLEKMKKTQGGYVENYSFGNVPAQSLTSIQPFLLYYGKSYPEFDYNQAIKSYNIISYGGGKTRNNKLYQLTKNLMRNMYDSFKKQKNSKSALSSNKKYLGGNTELDNNFPDAGIKIKDTSGLKFQDSYSYPSSVGQRISNVPQSPFSALWVNN